MFLFNNYLTNALSGLKVYLSLVVLVVINCKSTSLIFNLYPSIIVDTLVIKSEKELEVTEKISPELLDAHAL